jgi:hypothetical protein
VGDTHSKTPSRVQAVERKHIPAALVTKKLILGIQGLSRTEIAETTCYRAILFDIKAEVQECFISSSDCFTPQAPGLICQSSLEDFMHPGDHRLFMITVGQSIQCSIWKLF